MEHSAQARRRRLEHRRIVPSRPEKWRPEEPARATRGRHTDDVSERSRRATAARAAVVVAVAAVLGTGAGLVAHVAFSTESARTAALPPDLHGDATWATRRAPAFTLRDVLGGTRSLAGQRGHVTLVTFLDSRCHALCPLVGRAIGDTERALPERTRASVVVVSVDPTGDTAGSVRSAARRWRLVPGWHWLTGSHRQLAAVWRAYGITGRPRTNDVVHGAAVYLVDRRGYERAAYLAPLLPKILARDVRRVEAETSS